MVSLVTKSCNKPFIQLHSSDSVVVALQTIDAGDSFVQGDTKIVASTTIEAGHKCAIHPIAVNQPVYKYGMPIGIATCDIEPGEKVHTHNLRTALSGTGNYHYLKELPNPPDSNIDAGRTFMGYKRANGKVGTRNEIWVLSTVGCVSRLAQKVALFANEKHTDACDGVYAFTHPFGCSQVSDDLEATRQLTAALAQHPNAGGVLIMGLGCENNQLKTLLNSIPETFHSRIRFFNCQDTDDEVEQGLACIAELAALTLQDAREPCALSDLVLGMKCGGSDGFSGLSANPLVGRISERLCAANGIVLLTETPEMFGAEQLLMNRAANDEVFGQIVDLVNDFKQYFIDHGQNIYENPSPGNKEGGITTLEEKSIGAIQKGGLAEVTDVLQYAEPVKRKGLNLLQAPGNDAVSSTALAASGATLILFTTGRGTPLGFPAPTVKISSNSKLAHTKRNWIDFDAGRVFNEMDMDTLSDEFFDYLIELASGITSTCAEKNDQREIAIWKNGVTL